MYLDLIRRSLLRSVRDGGVGVGVGAGVGYFYTVC